MSSDINTLRAEYAEWKAQRTDITVSQRVLDAFRGKPLTAAQAYDALGISNQCGNRLLANAITNLCHDGMLRADTAYPRRYRFIRDASQPLSEEARAQRKAAELERRQARKALSHKRRLQALEEALERKSARRAAAATAARATGQQGATETVEQFIARGGQVEVLPHSFDTPRPPLPRRPTYSPRPRHD